MNNNEHILKLENHLKMLNEIATNNSVDLKLKDWLLLVKNEFFVTRLGEHYLEFERIISEYQMERAINRYSETYIEKQYIAIAKQYLTDLIYTLKLNTPCLLKNQRNFLRKVLSAFH